MTFLRELRSYRGMFDRRVWLLTYGQVLQSLGRGILMPFATLYFYNVQGFPLALIGLALAIAFPTGALVGLAWGALADRYGRKPLMLLGYGAGTITTAALAFVETIPQYFVVTILNAVSVAAWLPASRAMIADVTPPARRTRAFGLTYMATNLGLSFGLVAGGVLALLMPYRTLFLIEAAGSAAYFVVVLLFVQESFKQARQDAAPAVSAWSRVGAHVRDLSRPLQDRAFVLFAAASLLAGLGYSQFYIAWSPWLANVLGAGDAWIAIVFAINTVMVIALQIPIAHWAEERRRTYIFILSAYYMATSLLATWAAGRVGDPALALGLMVVACVLLTIQEIAIAPVVPALVAGLAGAPERVGKYMAGLELLFALNAGIGAIIGGAFFDAGRPHLLWPVMMGLALLSLPLYLWLAKLLPPDVNQPAPDVPSPTAPAAVAPAAVAPDAAPAEA